MSDNPLDKIRVLINRLQTQAEQLGLDLHQIAVVPHAPDVEAPDMLQAVFIVRPNAIMTDEQKKALDEQADLDAAFADIVGNLERDIVKEKTQERVDNAKEEMMRWLQDGDS